jgi:outer membrane protein assembly factor BamE (lipoprotein component of BamABCDE complex)
VHGVSNLKNKIKLIKINETNKNDITKILGPVPIENKEEKRWTYFEVRETKTKYGKRDIYVNDYVEIFFNNYGIADKIEFYDLSNMKNIKFAKEKTKSLGVKDTFSKNLLSSTRKRMENARKKFEK